LNGPLQENNYVTVFDTAGKFAFQINFKIDSEKKLKTKESPGGWS
jgi:hypothetical protein